MGPEYLDVCLVRTRVDLRLRVESWFLTTTTEVLRDLDVGTREGPYGDG